MTLVPLRTPKKHKVAAWTALADRSPTHAVVADVDLVITRYDDKVSVLYGRCAHRRALMSDGHVDGQNLICGVHGWDYRLDTGVSEYTAAVSVTVRSPAVFASTAVSCWPVAEGVSTLKSSAAISSDAVRPFSDTTRSPRTTPASAAGDSGST